jgi:CelD/BcsL family acetyltransferase involved in cellulose biosynthesis
MSWRFYPASQLAQHAGAWRALHAAGPASPLLELDFVLPLLAEFGTGAELLACCEQDGAPAAMTLLAPAGPGAWASFQPAQAPIGLWLARPGLELPPLLDGLVRGLPGCALVAGISQLDSALGPRPRDGGCVQTLDYIDTARITLDGGFDAFWEQRGKNLRANLKKQRARLAREGMVTRLERLRAPHEMAQAVADYARLEGASWKGRTRTAVQAGDAQERFYRCMLEAFAQRGHACVYRYWFGERLAAMDLCVESHDCIVVLKTTYDETIPAAYSPAMLMREEACRQLFEEGHFARLEFYGRVMDWHLRWTNEVRSLYHLNYYRWPLLRRLHALKRGHGAAEPAQPESHLE